MNRRGLFALVVVAALAVFFMRRTKMEPDFENMPAQELWDYIQAREPANDVLLVASAISVWDSRFGDELGVWPQGSGGTYPPRPPL